MLRKFCGLHTANVSRVATIPMASVINGLWKSQLSMSSLSSDRTHRSPLPFSTLPIHAFRILDNYAIINSSFIVSTTDECD